MYVLEVSKLDHAIWCSGVYAHCFFNQSFIAYIAFLGILLISVL